MLKFELDIIEDDILNWNKDILKILLEDKTTNKNIIWACEGYPFSPMEEIQIASITKEYSKLIQPRIYKNSEIKDNRTKTSAEVFTPSWICNRQNNLIDEAWFEKKNIFNRELDDETWESNKEKIVFPEGKNWQQYVDLRRLEISCGEAPYLVSRYDTTTGRIIPIEDRVGLLDRKLRIISENIDNGDEHTWIHWTIRAYQSIYGYEYQGDNLLLARENLLVSFIEYFHNRFCKNPKIEDIKKIANIISWNVFQMDATRYVTPDDSIEQRKNDLSNLSDQDMESFNFDKKYQQLSFFSDLEFDDDKEKRYCIVKNWRANKVIEFRKLVNK